MDDIAYLVLWGPGDRELGYAENCFIRRFWPEQNRRHPNPWCGGETFWARGLVSVFEPEDRPALRLFLNDCPFPLPARGGSMKDALLKELDRTVW